MVSRLVVNGCSYMAAYTDGQGHVDLAHSLGITNAVSLALGGSCNSRIMRTTLRDSYFNEPTLYVLGMTFLARYEIPSKQPDRMPDGRWLSYNNLGMPTQHCRFVQVYSDTASRNFADFWFRLLIEGQPDVMEDLQYRILSMIDSLLSRGHRVVVFNTADTFMSAWAESEIAAGLLRSHNIVDGLRWRSIPWQFSQGATHSVSEQSVPWDCRHVEPGQHKYLNRFLQEFIRKQDLL